MNAQAEMPPVKFNKVNPFLKNKYADLGAIIDTAQPVLAKHGLAVSQLCTTEGDEVGVETMLMHKSGEWIASSMSIPLGEERGKSTAQVAGSIVTYIRRYALAAILGMYADEDGDGNAEGAGGNGHNRKPKRKPQPKPKPDIVDQALDDAGLPDEEPMTIERAMKIENSEGELYGDLTSDRLSKMSIGIAKGLKKSDLTDEQRQTYEMKQEAVKVLLQARADGSI